MWTLTRTAEVQRDDCVSSCWCQQGESLRIMLEPFVEGTHWSRPHHLCEELDLIQLWRLLLFLHMDGDAALNLNIYFLFVVLLLWLHVLSLLQRQD